MEVIDNGTIALSVRQEYRVTIPPKGSPDRNHIEATIHDEIEGIQGEILESFIATFLIEKFHVGDFTQFVELKCSNYVRIY
jgi:hypothetical protein